MLRGNPSKCNIIFLGIMRTKALVSVALGFLCVLTEKN